MRTSKDKRLCHKELLLWKWLAHQMTGKWLSVQLNLFYLKMRWSTLVTSPSNGGSIRLMLHFAPTIAEIFLGPLCKHGLQCFLIKDHLMPYFWTLSSRALFSLAVKWLSFFNCTNFIQGRNQSQWKRLKLIVTFRNNLANS